MLGKNIGLDRPTIRLSSVNGHSLSVKGKLTLELAFDKQKYRHDFHVVDGITSSVILGYDFITDKEARLSFTTNDHVMELGHERVSLENDSFINSLVRLTEDVYLPAQTVTMTNGKRGRRKVGGLCTITKTNNGFMSSEPGLKIVDSVIELRGTKVPITLRNETNKSFTLKKGNVVGFISRIDADEIEEDEGERLGGSEISEGEEDEEVSVEFRQKIEELVRDNSEIFAEKDAELGNTKLIKMNIETGDHDPINLKAYRPAFHKRQIIEEQIEDMLKAGVIEQSRSPWAFPVVIVRKKDGSQRFCVDYRRLNDITQKYQWNLPHIDDILARLGNSKYFTSLDLKSGYWQIPMDEKDKEKTAFISHKGQFQFNKMPFGLCNAPSYFCELMEKVVGDLSFTIAYLDDLIIYSETEQEHIEHIREVFVRLREADLKLKRKKCEFFKKELKYLGHIIDKRGVRPDDDKLESIRSLERPTNVTEVRSFIGMCSFYRKFIQNFSKIAEPLTKLTRKHSSFEWNLECQHAFDELKSKLGSAEILAFPDLTKDYILYTDASDSCIGAVLAQNFDEGERPIQYLSHQLSNTQKRWPIIQKEAFAIVYAIQKFEHFLHGSKFVIKCDHKPLKYIFSSEMKNPKVQRWAMIISEHNCEIQYLEGKLNTKADFFSRVPRMPQNDDETVEKAEVAVGNAAAINTDAINPKEIRIQAEYYEKLRHQETPLVPETNFPDIKQEQMKDPELSRIIAELSGETPGKRDPYLLIDQVLYYTPDDEAVHKLVIPESLRGVVLRECHDNNCHMGMDKTYDKVRRFYHWRGIFRDVTKYVKSCVLCSANGMKKDLRPLQAMDTAKFPLEKICIDTCGPYPESHDGNKYLITVMDMFSGWPELYPVPDRSANTVANVLLNDFIPSHSCPLEILSDNGTEFCNQIVDSICERMKILRVKTSVYHPRSNGRIERLHRVWNMMASKHVDNDPRSWDKLVPSVLFAIRTSVNESSKYSPFYLLYNREPILPLDTLLRPRFKYLGDDFHETVMERQHEAFRIAQKERKRAVQRQQKYHNRRARKIDFEPHDPVYLFNNNKSNKWSKRWIPYYRIMKKNSEVNYTIKNILDGTTRDVHTELLKPASIDWVIPQAVDENARKSKFVVPQDTSSEDTSDSEFSNSREREGRRLSNTADSESENSDVSPRTHDSSDSSDDNEPLEDIIPLERLRSYERKRSLMSNPEPTEITSHTENTEPMETSISNIRVKGKRKSKPKSIKLLLSTICDML